MCAWMHMTPLEWAGYVNKEVKVRATDRQEHLGWMFTVDPVSASVVLVNFQEGGGVSVSLVMGHAVEQVEVVAEGDDHARARLRSVFHAGGAGEALSAEELRRRKQSVRAWLERNRIPVEEEAAAATGEEQAVLRVANVLTVAPPYRSEDCSSSNEIILARIQNLLDSNPDRTG